MSSTWSARTRSASAPITQNQTAEWFEWLRRDKGILATFGCPSPAGCPSCRKACAGFPYPNLIESMDRRGWPERIRKVMGENWLAFLKSVWGS